jgi:coproporphyrinogen III oxidase
MPATAAVREYLLALQQRIVDAMEQLDGGRFLLDGWTRAPGERLQGDGLTRCIDDGALLERAGCNFSHVRCRHRPPSTGPNSPARPSRRWACRW